MRTPLQVLNDIRIEEPCPADWQQMTGDNRVRHCAQCDRQVHNLSELSAAEGAELLERHAGHLCVRYHLRRDGTVITREKSASRWRLFARVGGIFTSLLLAGCRVQGVINDRAQPPEGCDSSAVTLQGDVAMGEYLPTTAPASSDPPPAE